MKAINQAIEDYENGHLKLAREAGRKYTWRALYDVLVNEKNYSHNRAALTADYLKTGRGFQDASDAK